MPPSSESKAATPESKASASEPGAAAFFDLDRTLMAGASAFHFGRAAYKAGLVTRREIAKDAWFQIKFRLRGSTDRTADTTRDRVLEAIKGVRQRDLRRLSPDTLAGILPRIYPKMLEEVHRHQDEGRPAYIASATPQEVAELLAAVLSMDGALGTQGETKDGVYTGSLDGPFVYGEGKAQKVREFAAANGFDLASSYAYSDSASDLPMLRAVGHAVVVNPDAELTRVAKSEGWRIMRFERLGRRIMIAASTLVAAAVGGSGTFLFARYYGRRGHRGGKGSASAGAIGRCGRSVRACGRWAPWISR